MPVRGMAERQAGHAPGDQDGPGAEHRQDVDHGDKDGDDKRVADADQAQADEAFVKFRAINMPWDFRNPARERNMLFLRDASLP